MFISINFFGYLFDLEALIIYEVVFIIVLYLMSRRFGVKNGVWFSILSISCFEFLWQLTSVFQVVVSYGLTGGMVLLAVRYLMLSVPMLVWFYYNVKLGQWLLGLLFVIPFVFGFCIVPTVFLRLITGLFVVMNMVFWSCR